MTEAQAIAPAPVRKTLTVKAPQARAFEVFARMGRWWPKSHSLAKSPQTDVVIEPFAGGRWYETNADGSTCEWGRVQAYDPPARLLLIWQLDADWKFDPGLITEVEVTFTPLPDGATRVDFEHRGLEAWGERAAQVRDAVDSEGGWTGILKNYAAAAEG